MPKHIFATKAADEATPPNPNTAARIAISRKTQVYQSISYFSPRKLIEQLACQGEISSAA
jgi:hypothetical protein